MFHDVRSLKLVVKFADYKVECNTDICELYTRWLFKALAHRFSQASTRTRKWKWRFAHKKLHLVLTLNEILHMKYIFISELLSVNASKKGWLLLFMVGERQAFQMFQLSILPRVGVFASHVFIRVIIHYLNGSF